jgi:hypothetical protein
MLTSLEGPLFYHTTLCQAALDPLCWILQRGTSHKRGWRCA